MPVMCQALKVAVEQPKTYTCWGGLRMLAFRLTKRTKVHTVHWLMLPHKDTAFLSASLVKRGVCERPCCLAYASTHIRVEPLDSTQFGSVRPSTRNRTVVCKPLSWRCRSNTRTAERERGGKRSKREARGPTHDNHTYGCILNHAASWRLPLCTLHCRHTPTRRRKNDVCPAIEALVAEFGCSRSPDPFQRHRCRQLR